jgi:hypothetical protein
VAGGRIGQVEPAVPLAGLAGVQVPAWQGNFPGRLAVQAHGQRPLLDVQGGDGAAAAVGHPELGDGVVAADYPVPDPKLAVPDAEALLAEAAVSGQDLLAVAVEPVHLVAAAGQHHHLPVRLLLRILIRLPPVGQQRHHQGRLGVGGHQPVMGSVGIHRLLHQAGTDQLQGLAFPGVQLPPVLR